MYFPWRSWPPFLQVRKAFTHCTKRWSCAAQLKRKKSDAIVFEAWDRLILWWCKINHHNKLRLIHATYKLMRDRRTGKVPRHSFTVMDVQTFKREIQTLVLLLDTCLRERKTKELLKGSEWTREPQSIRTWPFHQTV